MNSQHLSDEAVAAFADGVLRGHARERAARHANGCAECRSAVRSQREAVLALRSAPAPSLPVGLFERLQALPATTESTDSPMAPVHGHPAVPPAYFAPMAAFVTQPPSKPTTRTKPFATGAAVLVLTAGALAAGVVAHSESAGTRGPDSVTTRVDGTDRAPVMPEFVGARFARR